MEERISIAWTDLQVDAMTEVLNLGMGRACLAMSSMIGEVVEHRVPAFTIIAPEELARKLDREYPDGRCLVSQDFQGCFAGRSAFLLSTGKMALLSQAARVRAGQPDGGGVPAVDDHDAVCEVGNVVLGACLASLAGTLDSQLELEPATLRGDGSFDALCDGMRELDHSRTNLCCSTGFHTGSSGIDGLVVLMLGHQSAERVHHLVGEHIHRVMR